jgi:hypothetical protein
MSTLKPDRFGELITACMTLMGMGTAMDPVAAMLNGVVYSKRLRFTTAQILQHSRPVKLGIEFNLTRILFVAVMPGDK